jgi:general secretion pathway protein D
MPNVQMKNKKLLATLCIALPATILLPANAGFAAVPIGNVQGSAEREIARRQEAISQGEELMKKADKAMDEKDYETAISILISLLRDVNESKYSHGLRKDATENLCEAYVKLGEQRILEGRQKDAENLCNEALKYDPEYKPAVRLMAHLEDPDYFNKTITPGHVAHVEEVKKLLVEADGFYQTGRYDMAFKRYEQVLNIDPYNIAARKGEEKLDHEKSNYGVSAYNETRSRAMWQLDNAWQNPVRKYGANRVQDNYQPNETVRNTAQIEKKLTQIIIPKIDFRETSIREAIDFLKEKSRQLDPDKVGVNIVLKLDNAGASAAAPAAGGAEAAGGIPGLTPEAAAAAPAGSNPNDARITLSLSNIPLMEALRYITDLANLKVKIDPYAISIVPVWVNTETLLTKEYKVPPGFIQSVPAGGGADTGGAFPKTGGAEGANTGKELVGRNNAQQFLGDKGIQFPTGATAQYLPGSGKLIVHNTQSNLDLIDALVEAEQGNVPKQVEIEAKFVEITQNNLKELGFSWLLGQFNFPGSDGVFGGGGTAGTSPAVNAADYPFVTPGGSAVGSNPVTGGNRSGNLAISQNAIDALLFGVKGASSLSPAAFALSGVFTDPQFQVVIRALNQKKGVDLLSAPRVTTKAGQRAVIEIIREFRYPTEFDPPQIPQNVGGSSTSAASGSVQVFPVTPTTPTSFETRNTGVTLEVEPQVSPDGATIDLNLVPQVVEFEGFINYGSPIKTVNPAALATTTTSTGGLLGGLISAAIPTGASDSVILTDNVINQPIFSTRKVTTSVSIWDGQTVVLGGLMREDVQKVEDKVPLLGDIPMLGRLFRSNVDQHIKRNLVIFVTARLMDPAGEPLHSDNEDEEVVEPLPLPGGLPPAQQPEAPLFSK